MYLEFKLNMQSHQVDLMIEGVEVEVEVEDMVDMIVEVAGMMIEEEEGIGRYFECNFII